MKLNAIELSEQMIKLFLDELDVDTVDRTPRGDEKEATFEMVKFHD